MLLLIPPKDSHPALAFWDIKAAFPSLNHDFLWLVLRALRFPFHIIRFLHAIYNLNCAFVMHTFAVVISSGTMQGCPLSGFLFATATSHFLSHIISSIDSRGLALTRVCADDIGAATCALAVLSRFKVIFDAMQAFARLSLVPKKCKLAPIKETISTAVRALVPDWSFFEIADVPKYFGINL